MKMAFLLLLKNRIKALPALMRDRSVALHKKMLVVFGMIYLVLPVDLIPPMIPVLGAFDDIILWGFILSYLKEDLDRYVIPQEGGNGARKYSGRDVVDAEYTVDGGSGERAGGEDMKASGAEAGQSGGSDAAHSGSADAGAEGSYATEAEKERTV